MKNSAERLRSIRIMLPLLALILSVYFVSSCKSDGPMTFDELAMKRIFPDRVGEKWSLEGKPEKPDELMPGYITVNYGNKDYYGTLRIWVIDKGTGEEAQKWLDDLLNGRHNAVTISPLAPSEAVSGQAKEYYSAFLENPIMIRGFKGYERSDLQNFGGLPGFYYMLYIQMDRYIVGAEDLHYFDSLDQVRREVWPVIASLNLP